MENNVPFNMYQDIFDHLADVVFILAVEGYEYKFLSVNPAFLQTTGLKSEQVIGKLASEVIPPESYQQVSAYYAKAIAERRPVRWHEVSDYPTGKKYGNVTVVPLFNKDGVCYALAGTVHDVTAVIEADIKMRETMERIGDGLVSFDKNMNYTFVNNKGGEFLERRPEDLIGKNYFKEYPEAQGTTFAKAYLEALNEQKYHEISDFYPSWNKWFENRIYPSKNGITIFFTDISQRVETEHELEEARRLANESLKAREHFLDIAAHELRNPVTTVYLMLKALLVDLKHDKTINEEHIEKLLVPAERLNRLVTELMDISRLQKQLVKLNKKQMNLTFLVKTWTQEMLLKYPDRKIHLHASDDEVMFNLDEVRIYQVFSNILDNALKYSPQTEPVDIYLENTASGCRLSVKDRGEGISEEALPLLFDPFVHAGHHIKVRHNGLGIGLAISKSIIELHGGRIDVESMLGKGSTFSIVLEKGK